MKAANTDAPPVDFIRKILRQDLQADEHLTIATRFPPEPNGFLHIGHAKAICLNFGVAQEFGGTCRLRLDDTNPLKEDTSYVEAIQEDIHWLGFDWSMAVSYASDYFEELYRIAEKLVQKSLAYVDSQRPEEIREQRGTLTTPGQDSPWRARDAAENLELLRQMRAGQFAEGEHVLRAKIDMTSDNLNMRDPILYRIRHVAHHRTGNNWCIYPMYDYTHALCDALENITHSLCTLEFEDNRALYDWMLEAADTSARPRQIEFSRLQLEHTLTSKRQLVTLIEQGKVTGWDDPRMPTLAGLRRRGVSPASIRNFCAKTGVTKKNHTIEMSSFEHSVRRELEHELPRAFALMNPLKLIVDNWPADEQLELSAPWHPQQSELGTRALIFSQTLYIERDDFSLQPPKGYKRLVQGADVRLRYGYILRCGEPEMDAKGEVQAVHCSIYKDSRSGEDNSGVRARGVIHWLSAVTAVPAVAHLYDRLFSVSDPGRARNVEETLNPGSLIVCDNALVEPEVARASARSAFQFERTGYFIRDAQDATDGRPLFNRTLTLRDTWSKA